MSDSVSSYPGFLKRSLAFSIDILIVLIVGHFIIAIILAFVGILPVFLFKIQPEEWLDIQNLPENRTIMNIGVLVFSWMYFTFSESSSKQATHGKRWLKITVTDVNGKRISFIKSNLRNIIKIISFLTCIYGFSFIIFPLFELARTNPLKYWGTLIPSIILLIGFLIAGFTKNRQSLHDIILETTVVRKITE